MIKQFLHGYGEPRPVAITIICILGIASNLVEIITILFVPHTTFYTRIFYNSHYHLVAVCLNTFFICAFIGLWRMRLWGFILLIGAIASTFLYGYFIGIFFEWAIVPSLILFIICVIYFKEMQ